MIQAISFNGTGKPYNGFLKSAKPGSTVNAGRNIITKRDIEYANANNLNIHNPLGSRKISTEPKEGINLKSIINFFKKLFKSSSNN